MAITTPFFSASNSTTPEVQIEIATINSFSKLDVPQVGNTPAKYQILFAMTPGSSAQSQTLSYETAALRDTDFTTIEGHLSTAI
jgi:peptidoglycan hydrolase-like amidase